MPQMRGSSWRKGLAEGTRARPPLHAAVCSRAAAWQLPLRRLCRRLLWEASGKDPSPDGTSGPPTPISATAEPVVSSTWQAASLLPATPQHPRSPPGPGQPPAALAPAPDALGRGELSLGPGGQPCRLGWSGAPAPQGPVGVWLRGVGDPHPHSTSGLGSARESCVAAAAGNVPGHGCVTEAGAVPGAEPVATNVCSVHVRVSVHVRLCMFMCLCMRVSVCAARKGHRPGQVSAAKKWAWGGIVSQAEPREGQNHPLRLLCGHRFHLHRGCGRSGSGHTGSPPGASPGAGQGPSSAWGRCAGTGGLALGGRGDGSRRKGIVHLWSVHCVPFAGGTMSPFTHRPPSSLLSLLPRRVVEASTLQQERLQAIAVSPCARRVHNERAGPRAGVPTSRCQCPHVPVPVSPGLRAAYGADTLWQEGAGAGAAGGSSSQSWAPLQGRGSLAAK